METLAAWVVMPAAGAPSDSLIELHRLLAWGDIAVGVPSCVALMFISAPYGRHARSGWGPSMPMRWAWVLMESPAVLGFAAVYFMGGHRFDWAPLVLLGLWQLHYVNRTFVYPLRLQPSDKRTPLAVVAMALCFNCVNAWLNATQVAELGGYAVSWLYDPRFIAGVALFVTGRSINMRADAMLIALRAKGEGYQIPRGGLYRWISCPNYLGEMVEWLGWAVATWSLAGAAFAVFTVANLLPRALTHHRWYQQTFSDYPRGRKAVIPGLL